MTRLALFLVLALPAGPASAFRGEKDPKGDAGRFGLDRPQAPPRPRAKRYAPQSAVRLDQLRKAGARVRYNAAGAVSGVLGPIPARGGAPEAAALGFLRDYSEALELDPSTLALETRRDAAGHTHLLFNQTHLGLPVEFSRVKVHLGPSGEIVALHTSHQVDIAASPVPRISAAQAAASVSADLGGAAPEGGTLVYLPVPKTGEVRLAWKLKAGGDRSSWIYYVDAETGGVLLRYNDLRFIACPSGTSGTVLGEVFDVDPASTPLGPPKPMRHQKVWQYSTQQSTYAVTLVDGSFCNSGTAAKIVTSLQGPYVNVSRYSKTNLHYDNGNGKWNTVVTPVSSPSPYANSSKFPTDNVFTTAFNNPPFADAMGQIIHFDFFEVGAQDAFGDITDDDQVHVLDSEGKRVASYVGHRQPFNTAAAYGCLDCEQRAGRDPMRVILKSNQATQGLGFRVNVSSYLVLQSAPVVAANPSNVVWLATHTADGTRDEMNIFYHLNLMHDYFIGDVDKSSAAWISSGVVATAHFGPDLGNAFFDPDHNNFAFGDLGGGIALDATVVHHEFVHFVVDKIYPIVNFGQNGALSEAWADYFSASSLNVPSIGKFVGSSFGTESALRDLACVDASSPRCSVFPNHWEGEIHQDDLPVAQALWEVRSDLIGTLGSGVAVNGQSCADGLVFQALFFFPDSFQEFLDSMLLVDAAGTVARCGGANVARTTILNRFAHHGITEAGGLFAYEPNDGTQSAIDISTISVVSASIFPGADLDYYTFAAGPGHVKATLDLPAVLGGGSFYNYGLTLVDSRLRSVAEAYPAADVNPTLAGGCPNINCQTTAPRITLAYDNPGANQFYLLVSAGITDQGSNGATNSPTPYALSVDYQKPGALAGSVVDAKFDNDKIDFTVTVSSFARQNLAFAYAQLRDHRMAVLPNTRADCLTPSFLTLQNCPGGPTNGDGKITGSVRVTNFGGQTLSQRFPSVGTVYLEVFANNLLQLQASQFPGAALAPGAPQSLGMSSSINLAAAGVDLNTFNNLFNPLQNQVTTVKYEVQLPGRVRLQLFSKTGALVATLFDGEVTAGKGSVDWNGRNLAGHVVASGVYLLRLEGPGGAQTTRKVVVVK